MAFICFAVSGHPGCFHLGAIVNTAALNMRVQVSMWTCVFISSG